MALIGRHLGGSSRCWTPWLGSAVINFTPLKSQSTAVRKVTELGFRLSAARDLTGLGTTLLCASSHDWSPTSARYLTLLVYYY